MVIKKVVRFPTHLLFSNLAPRSGEKKLTIFCSKSIKRASRLLTPLKPPTEKWRKPAVTLKGLQPSP